MKGKHLSKYDFQNLNLTQKNQKIKKNFFGKVFFSFAFTLVSSHRKEHLISNSVVISHKNHSILSGEVKMPRNENQFIINHMLTQQKS